MENVMLFTLLMYISATFWYAEAPVGILVLQKTVGKLFEQAMFSSHFTNHSLCATAATRVYDAGVNEQLIAEKNWEQVICGSLIQKTKVAPLVKVSEIIQGNEKPPKDDNKENVRKLRTEEDSKYIWTVKLTLNREGYISFKFKF